MPVRDWTIRIGGKDEASNAIRGVAKNILAMGAAYLSLREGLQFAKEAIAASAEQEKQERRLWAALQQTGQATRANFEALNANASALQRLTTVEDDAGLAAQMLFVRFGATVSEAGRLTGAAADLAAVMGGTLEQRAVLLSRALNGSTVMLEKMGIHLDKTKIAAGGAAYIVGELNKKFGGAAQAETETYAGRMMQLNNVWGDFKEVVGDSITKSQGVADILKVLSTIVLDLQVAFKTSGDTIGVLFAAGLKTVLDTTKLLVDGLGTVATVFGSDLADSLATASYKLEGYGQQLENNVTFGRRVIDTENEHTEAIRRVTGATEKQIEAIKKRQRAEYEKEIADEKYMKDEYRAAIELEFQKAEKEQADIDRMASYYQHQRDLAENNSKKIQAITKKLNDGIKKIDDQREADAKAHVASMMEYIGPAASMINDVFYEIGAGTEDIFRKMSMAVLNFARQALQMAAMRAWAEALLAVWLNPVAAGGLFAAAAAISAAAAGLSLVAGVASRGGEATPTREARTTEGGRTRGYASGSSYVPETGLALVHKGETITPPGYRDRDYPGRESGGGGMTNWFVSALDARSFRDAIMREVDAALRQRAMLPDGRMALALRR